MHPSRPSYLGHSKKGRYFLPRSLQEVILTLPTKLFKKIISSFLSIFCSWVEALMLLVFRYDQAQVEMTCIGQPKSNALPFRL
jgi:hypothetical protein